MSLRSKHHILEAHRRWKEWLHPGDLAVDATCGNGHDTAALLEMGAQVIAIDIQPQALANSKQKCLGVEWHLRCHSELKKIINSRRAKLIVYNLGYLPGGDKSITTCRESTLASVQAALECADAISITLYPGHPEGARERDLLLDALSNYEHLQWGSSSTAPSLVWVVSDLSVSDAVLEESS